MGAFDPGRLPLNETEYTTMGKVRAKLPGRSRPYDAVPDERVAVAAQSADAE
jgi:fructose 1,6-bisphosphatase